MNPLLTLQAHQDVQDCTPRPTVKAVIMDENNNVLLFGRTLLGGGVEENEGFEEALKRECLEEAGLTIEIVKPIGMVIQYRDYIQKRYEVWGFLTRIVGEKVDPSTMQADEVGAQISWKPYQEACTALHERIQQLEALPVERRDGDAWQGKLYNYKTTLTFLEALE